LILWYYLLKFVTVFQWNKSSVTLVHKFVINFMFHKLDCSDVMVIK